MATGRSLAPIVTTMTALKVKKLIVLLQVTPAHVKAEISKRESVL
jgi:hypothetical protein